MHFLEAYDFEEDFEMKKRVFALLAVAAVVGMVAVGCGSSNKETEATTTEAAATTEATTEATTDAAADETEATTTEAAADDTEAETTEAPADEETEA